jgi:two-component SAPR family response regulator
MFSVDFYSDPKKALNDFQPGTYELAIFDIRMPVIDGTELYKRVRSIDKRIKVCFISAYEITVEELSRILPDYVLNCLFKKPVPSKVFVERVVEVISAS